MNTESPEDNLEVPEDLIITVVDQLRGDTTNDLELLDILSEHIMKISPAETAVKDATSAIEALATKRVEEPNDPIDHN